MTLNPFAALKQVDRIIREEIDDPRAWDAELAETPQGNGHQEGPQR